MATPICGDMAASRKGQEKLAYCIHKLLGLSTIRTTTAGLAEGRCLKGSGNLQFSGLVGSQTFWA
jgi:hypothetical protein